MVVLRVGRFPERLTHPFPKNKPEKINRTSNGPLYISPRKNQNHRNKELVPIPRFIELKLWSLFNFLFTVFL